MTSCHNPSKRAKWKMKYNGQCAECSKKYTDVSSEYMCCGRLLHLFQLPPLKPESGIDPYPFGRTPSGDIVPTQPTAEVARPRFTVKCMGLCDGHYIERLENGVYEKISLEAVCIMLKELQSLRASHSALVELLEDILTWDGILPHSKTRIKETLAKHKEETP